MFTSVTVSRFTYGLIILSILTGCSMMNVSDFKGAEPRLRLEEFFDGKTYAVGIFRDRFGTVRRQFTVDIEGSWDGTTLTLVEDFNYRDGETEQRIWKLQKLDDHRYEGTASGVVGMAHGAAYGNAFNWKYTFDLKVGDSTWRVDFDDWMFLQPGGVLVNVATIEKFGFELGVVTLSFSRKVFENSGKAEIQTTDMLIAAE